MIPVLVGLLVVLGWLTIGAVLAAALGGAVAGRDEHVPVDAHPVADNVLAKAS